MKKIMCLIFILLTSCTSTPASPPPVSKSPPPIPISSSFAYNQECPHVCWLGINPGATTSKEAEELLHASNQIDQISYSDNGIWAKWNTGDPNQLPSRVGMSIENGTVKIISFSPFPLKIGEFVGMMRAPDEISIKQSMKTEGVFTEYIVYYMSMRAILYISVPIADGPSANDIIDILMINISPEDSEIPKWVLDQQTLRQPWLGFGHLEEYLKNRPSPDE